MGAWGTGSFENDDAANWIAELGTIVPDHLAQILVQAADYPSYLEAPASRIAVAAAEVIAALNGSPAQEAPPRNYQMDDQSTDVHSRAQGSGTTSFGTCAEKL